MKRHTGTSRRARPWVAGLVLVACGSALAVTGGPAAAAPEAVNGFFRVQSETGTECASSVGVCLRGTVSGRIKATSRSSPRA